MAEAPTPQVEGQKNNKTTIYIVVGVVVFCCLCCAALLIGQYLLENSDFTLVQTASQFI